MIQYMAKVKVEGNIDYVHVKAKTMKQAIAKVTKIYRGAAFLDIMERKEYKSKSFKKLGYSHELESLAV